MHAIPLKTIVPLLERGSQEEPTDERMISMWGNLLASSATTDAVSPRFISLLAEMNRRQALLLIELFEFEESTTVDLHDRAGELVESPLALNAIEVPSPHIVTAIVEAAGPALLAIDAVSPIEPSRAHTKFKRVNAWEAVPQRATDLGILESLGLISFRTLSTGYFEGSYVSLEIGQGTCTPLGDELLYLVGEADPD
ncbi:DUF4393 domain-containing protein [Reyranella aquatilis]|uniref:DUF4393 domain-containing protein n=1 Tax=Reyranella aquatilis TaxID=2035356 RepID=A0ABS8L3G0_9HYPH|nr:hypothetical protein [Reyranella aquatilis]MCC8432880.1 DUF4393 domain-containing protein [Reyranella aquatilis]